MPFQDGCEQTFDSAVKPAFSELKREYADLAWDVTKANAPSDTAIYPNKVAAITDRIREADILVVDLTGLNPNVMWELGYCDALHKRRLLIKEHSDTLQLPFNIRIDEVIQYSPTAEGRRELKGRIIATMRAHFESIVADRRSLQRDPDIEANNLTISDNLQNTPANSFLKAFALRELQRLSHTTGQIRDGRYQIRNIRPPGEIIQFFDRSLHMLGAETDTFDTVSCLEFWKIFTDEGTDFNYLISNAQAAKKGATIRRILILDKKYFPQNTVLHDDFASKLLRKMHQKSGAKLRVKLHFAEEYNEAMKTYGNFGILGSSDDTLVFCPRYEVEKDEERKMVATEFYHSQGGPPQTSAQSSNKESISQLRSKFDDLWEDETAQDLSASHYK